MQVSKLGQKLIRVRGERAPRPIEARTILLSRGVMTREEYAALGQPASVAIVKPCLTISARQLLLISCLAIPECTNIIINKVLESKGEPRLSVFDFGLSMDSEDRTFLITETPFLNAIAKSIDPDKEVRTNEQGALLPFFFNCGVPSIKTHVEALLGHKLVEPDGALAKFIVDEGIVSRMGVPQFNFRHSPGPREFSKYLIMWDVASNQPKEFNYIDSGLIKDNPNYYNGLIFLAS